MKKSLELGVFLGNTNEKTTLKKSKNSPIDRRLERRVKSYYITYYIKVNVYSYMY